MNHEFNMPIEIDQVLPVAFPAVRVPGAHRLKARRPDLYAKLIEPLPPGQKPVVNPGWRMVGGK